MAKPLGRFRIHDRPVPIDEALTIDSRRRTELSGRQQIEVARQEVLRAENAYRPFLRKLIIPGGPHEKPEARLRKELEEARRRLESLRFVFEDHAPDRNFSHLHRLRQINRRNQEFWRIAD